MNIADAQHHILTVNDNLEPFQGKWVLIRDGSVIAHAAQGIELQHLQEDMDLIMPVPAQGIWIF